MKNIHHKMKFAAVLILLLTFFFSSPLFGQMGQRTPGDSAATSYAPVEVLDSQMKLAVSELEAKIRNEADWPVNGSEVRRLANVIAVFGQIAGLHDQYCTFKDGATNIIEKAYALGQAQTWPDAQTCWEALRKALVSRDSKNLSWGTRVGSLAELMRSVAIYDSEIQGKMEKFRGLDAASGRAIALAALFQGLTANASETIAPERSIEWQEFCMKSRDASYYLFITLDARDRKHSPKNLATLHETCTACHAEFRKEN